MRCFRCQKYGHTQTRCKSPIKICKFCAQDENNDDHLNCEQQCPNEEYCPNCEEKGHTAADKDCPCWQREIKICNHMSDANIPYRQARQHLLDTNEIHPYLQKAKKRPWSEQFK